jgi:exosortase/archaeosortase family protein
LIKKISTTIGRFIRTYHLDAFRDVAIFMVILLFFHFLWRTFVRDILSVEFIRDSANWLAYHVYVQAGWVLNLLSVEVTAFDELNIGGGFRQNVFYYAGNNGYVSVNSSCSGLKQFYQWVILMLLFPGPWKHKAWFIPLGLGVIHLVNVFRILTMVFVTIHLPQHWDFIHDWVLRPFFYVVMFFLWVWWNEKFHLKKREKAKASSA